MSAILFPPSRPLTPPSSRQRTRLAHALVLLLVSILILVSAKHLPAQSFTAGGIGGQLTDPSGKAVVGARVKATEIATDTTAETESNADGEYLIERLKPGIYKVAFAAPGFKDEVVDKLEVQLDRTFRLDKQLALGSASDTVTVAATDTSLNYDSPEISTTLTSEEVEELPIVGQTGRGRSPYLLAVLAPGAYSTSNSNNNVNNFSLGGGRPVTNEILIDGLPSTNPSDNTYTYTPSPESIEELKITTTPFSAELGHTGGGVLLANTRHGANQYHLSLYTYYNNRLLNAENYFQTVPNLRYDQNDPGITASGPLSLPHHSGRDKTFFFTDLNVTYSNKPPSSSNYSAARTPTDAEKSGNFSQDGITIYDPATTAVSTDSQGNQVITRQPFAGNIIPADRIDPVAAQLVKYFPEPNGSFGGGNNYQVIPIQRQQILQGMLRIDHTISEQDSIFARYGRYTPNEDAVTYIPNVANPNNTNGWYDNQLVANETHIFGPTASNDFRFGFVQEINYTDAGGRFPSSLGLTGVPMQEFPNIGTSNFIGLGAQGPFHDRDRSYIFIDNVLLQRGRHNLKFGGDYRHQMYKFFNENNNVDSGSYSFDNTFTQTDTVSDGVLTGNTGGFDLADLLLGYPTQTVISSDFYTYREVIDSASLYAQDDWKLAPNLTVNLGLRWEFDGPDSEANNQFASFSPAKINSQTGNLGDALFAGYQGAPSHFAPNIFYNFLPRVGAEWSPIKNTVFRGGFGAYRLPSIGFYYIGPLSKYQKYATLQSTNGYTPAFQLAQGVPSVPYYQDAQGNPEIPASLCTVDTVESGACNPTSTPLEIDSRDRTPYNLVFQFGVERQFGSWFADLEYVGNHGVKRPIQYSINQLTPSQFTVANDQAFRPFPQYSDVQFFGNQGGSNYQSFQAQLQHKWKDGLVITGAYTFSKLMDDVDANDRVNGAPVQNVYDLHAERGIASADVPQRFVTNYVYQLPFGRGRRFASSTPVVRDIVAGWQMSGIVQFQIGQPIQISQSDNNPTTAAQRPNLAGSPKLPHFKRNLNEWFNTAAFTPVSIGVLGSSPRFPIHGPGINRTDVSMKRTFALGERIHLDVRADFDNVFNHPNFGNPGGNVGNVGSPNTSFGVVTGAQTSRMGQLDLKLYY